MGVGLLVSRCFSCVLDVFRSLGVFGWLLGALDCWREVLGHHDGEQRPHSWQTGADDSNIGLNDGQSGLITVVECYVCGVGERV
jgi:hypothetical protein